VGQDDYTHRWDPAGVPDAAREALLGPGKPFELAEEKVLGVPTRVFKNRPPHLRAILERAVTTMPDTEHLVLWDQSLTFAGLGTSVARLADHLAVTFGVEKGDRVAIAAANVPQYPIAWWATASLGAVVAGLNGWWTPAELGYGVELSKPKVIFADQRRIERLREANIPSDIPIVDLAELDLFIGPPGGGDPALPDVAIDEDDPATILFTSGTTGRRKGATISHRVFVHCHMAATLNGAIGAMTSPSAASSGGSQPTMILTGPLFHVSGCLPLTMGAFVGSRIVVPPVGAWDEETHLRLTQEYKVSGWSCVPTQLWRLMEHPKFGDYDVSSVATVGGGGAVYSPELFRTIADKMPHTRIGCGYGMSETLGSGTRLGGVLVTTHPASVGSVEPLAELQIRDEDGTPLPDGKVGEICIRGPMVFVGYWDNPEASADVLDAHRWYRTGDYGHFQDGILFLESRMRDMIIRGGENIYPIEIENRLVEHPDIADACVVGVDHKVLGQEVAAVIVRHEGKAIEPDAVRAWVGAALASYKVPAHVLFRDELPYNATGKVVKHEVEAEVAEELGVSAA
jgi:acyl-CoA synthetase (AMP-forming)/AMP-acid ligase II